MARRPSNVREQILDAAVRLLKTGGMRRLAQPQVAKEAGVPQGHLTYYFPRKYDLLVAVSQRFAEMVRRELQEYFTGAAWNTLGTSVRARVLASVGELVKNHERTRMLLGLLVESEGDPSLRDILANNAMRARTQLATVLGRAENDPDVDLALAMFWGLGVRHLLFEGRHTDVDTDALVARMADWLTTVLAHAREQHGGDPGGGTGHGGGHDPA
jgi:DNA-binding transcriptional regulator YbjK